jgi:dethiobiotin synthetase
MPPMRGVTVVGCGLDSGEALVAAAAHGAAAAAGEDARLFVTAAIGTGAEEEAELTGAAVALRTAATPAIAARHAGTQLDPAALVQQARTAAGDGLLVAAAPGGLMAPLTQHYSVRDFARELGMPLMLVARATGGVTGQLRLAGEAARAAGLPVAAVVLTGWPDPPSRVQLDERELTTAIARVPVLTLPEGARSSSALAAAAAGWDVAAWTEAASPPAASEPTAGAEPVSAPTVLDEYEAWTPHAVGDPRNTPRPKIMDTILEIVSAEGPMTATRAYSLYNRAAGGKKLTSIAKAPLSSAVYWLAREEKLTLTREAEIPWQGDDLIRLPDQPPVRVRELGPRTLDEVPLDEIAKLVKLLSGAPDMKRAILNAYGLVRLTSRADEYLQLAIDLAQ